ncbi:MAG TPA: DUF5985 family protein [Candidatus Acidoferrum sp.]|nr:DUF5985 family protein [Candidatus Acidoferrum sp.]
MAETVYLLCAATSLLCFVLLLRAFRRSRSPLLLWSSLAFFCFTASNVLLFVDMILFPHIDLMLMRTTVNLIGVALLLARLIRDSVNHRA